MLKPLILIVEDNKDVLYNIKLTLELNDFEVITSKNGKFGLKILEELERPPDVIVSDIMMPEMDGYTFFKKVSENPKWYQIPFMFLTAKSLPEDIRFGKMLGIDDYIVKPFKVEDLLAAINGKLKRRKIREKISSSIDIDVHLPITDEEKKSIDLIFVIWDDKIGPMVHKWYPREENLEFLNSIGLQLFQSAISIYGQKGIYNAQGLMLEIHNIKRSGYIYFDSKEDESYRAGRLDYMFGVLALKINYFQSLKIKEIIEIASKEFKEENNLQIEEVWKEITNILTEHKKI
ncbi:MAG: response regulator [Candidatus Lokiarchaeota archaeon]|nr:response regulator [Candidatus Lokiarchaeota archaeon]